MSRLPGPNWITLLPAWWPKNDVVTAGVGLIDGDTLVWTGYYGE